MRRQTTGTWLFCLACLGCATDPQPTQIRISNDSSYAFAAVTADGLDFGDIPAGALTAYRAHDASATYGAVALVIGSKAASFTPGGHSGAASLGTGYFTYHVTATASGGGYWLGVVASTD